MNKQVLSITVAICSISALHCYAQSTAFTYQGALQQNGAPYTGSAEMQFTLWDAASGGAAVATNSPATVTVGVSNGLFTSGADFGAGAFPGADRWLQIDVRTTIGPFTPLTPRQKVTAAPYALRSREAAGVPPGAITTGMIAPGAVTDTQLSGITTAGKVANSATTAASTNAAGAIVARDTSGSFAASGVSIQAGTSIAALSVVGTRDGFFGTPLGLFQNLNATGNSGPALRVVNEGGNSIDGALSVSAAGTGDIAVFGNAAAFVSRLGTNGTWSARAFEADEYFKAGSGHELSGFASSILGGFNNTNRALYSLIGAGSANSIGTNSSYQVIGGGGNNSIGTNSSHAVIGGGRDNSIGSNTISAVVPGGRNNTANGSYSFAAGRFARADHTGAFVWGDSTASDFPSTAANQFSVRAGGGVRFVTSGAGMTLDGQPVLAGTVGTASLADNAVTSAKIVDGSVATAELADGAVTSAKLGGDSVSSTKIVNGTIVPADLSLPAFDPVFWRTSGNTGTTSANFIGTTDNQPFRIRVNNTEALRIERTPAGANLFTAPSSVGTNVSGSTIAGGYANTILDGVGSSTISGGENNTLGAGVLGSAIGGGIHNTNASSQAAIGGGANNNVQSNAAYAVVGGGSGNGIGIGASSAVIAGGESNGIQLSAYGSTISGGQQNVIQTNANRSTIGGGYQNIIWADSGFGTIGGGWGNEIGLASLRSTIAGGDVNTIESNAWWGAIGGGFNNTILSNAWLATIPGGSENAAGGYYSFAAGRRAKANHQGAFVWGDSTAADFASTTANQFRVRAAGGMEVVGGPSQPALHFLGARTGGFGTAVGFAENTNTSGQSAPALRVVNNGGDSIDGALSVSAGGTGYIASFGNSSTFVSRLSTNGTWTAVAFTPVSDRAAKEHFAPVNAREVLDKVAALPVARWNYRAAPGLEHIGPVAQDFHAAFGLNGDDDKHIATVDADGVALAAIQGLNEIMKEKDARIIALEKQNAVVENRLAVLEKLVVEMTATGTARSR